MQQGGQAGSVPGGITMKHERQQVVQHAEQTEAAIFTAKNLSFPSLRNDSGASQQKQRCSKLETYFRTERNKAGWLHKACSTLGNSPEDVANTCRYSAWHSTPRLTASCLYATAHYQSKCRLDARVSRLKSPDSVWSHDAKTTAWQPISVNSQSLLWIRLLHKKVVAKRLQKSAQNSWVIITMCLTACSTCTFLVFFQSFKIHLNSCESWLNIIDIQVSGDK